MDRGAPARVSTRNKETRTRTGTKTWNARRGLRFSYSRKPQDLSPWKKKEDSRPETDRHAGGKKTRNQKGIDLQQIVPADSGIGLRPHRIG